MNIIVKSGAIGMGLALLWHFSNIARFGTHLIQEPNQLTLICEVVLILFLVILSTISLVKDFK